MARAFARKWENGGMDEESLNGYPVHFKASTCHYNRKYFPSFV